MNPMGTPADNIFFRSKNESAKRQRRKQPEIESELSSKQIKRRVELKPLASRR